MKMKDFDSSIDLMDSTAADILEKLTSMDPSSDEYNKAVTSLKTLEESKQIEVRNKSEHLSGKIPVWATTIFGSVLAVAFGAAVMREERQGGVVSSQSVSVFDKIIRKF